MIDMILPSSYFGYNDKLYSLFILITFVFSVFILAYMTFRMEKNKLYFTLFFALMCLSIWIIATFFKHSANFTFDQNRWLSVEYFARIMFAPTWYLFSEAYISRHRKMKSIPGTFLVVAFFFFYSITAIGIPLLDKTQAVTVLFSLQYLLGFMVCYVLILFSIYRLKKYAKIQKGVFIKQINMLSIGVYIITVSDFVFGLNTFGLKVDIVPIAIAVALVFIWRSITQYKLLEVVPIAIREVFNNMEESVIVVNEDGTILDTNQSALRLFKDFYLPERDINIINLLTNVKDKISNFDEINALLQDGLSDANNSFTIDTTIFYDPPMYLHLQFGPIYDKTKRAVGYIIVIDDITYSMTLLIENEKQNTRLLDQNYELEAQTQELEAQKEELMAMNEDLESTMIQLKSAQNQLIHSEKMASLGNLVAGIAHEINTPLGSINSNLDITNIIVNKLSSADDISNNPELINLVKKLERVNEINSLACHRILEIVLSLKNFSRLDEADFQKADIHEGINSTLLLLNNQIKNKIIVFKDFGEISLIDCYPNQLNQVFMNILVNATQAIEEKGEIFIKTYEKDENVIIEIIDTGKGIKEENLQKLFDPGFTTKGVGVGTGLGLSITYKIVENHNGKVYAENTKEHGAKFSIILPINNIREN